jgi:hypothetical protein
MAEYPKEFIYDIDNRRPIIGVKPGGTSGINFNALGGIDGYVPKNDPTFTSGLNYAQSIAGGQNVPNMIAPGVSYSAANPQGYTQMDLPPSGLPNVNIVTDTPPDRALDANEPPDYSQLPPNIIGGGRGDNISILDGGGGLKGVFSSIKDFIAQNPDKTRQGGNILGRYNPLDLTGIQSVLDSFKKDAPVVPPLEDRGFGPGIRRSEDFFRPEDLMMPPVIPTPPPSIGGVGGRDIEDRLLIDERRMPPPLEDIGFGPGIRRSEDFFRPEELMMPPVPPMEDINIPEIPGISEFIINDDLPVFEEPRFVEDINRFNNFDPFLNQPIIPNGSDFSIEQSNIPSGSRFSMAQPMRGLLR